MKDERPCGVEREADLRDKELVHSFNTCLMEKQFTPDSLVAAIRTLFELNNYAVEGPVHINGAEVDLVATAMSGIFSPPIYIEATVQYVNNDKYGKDLTKFAMLRNTQSDAQCLIVSSTGFTPEVRERAKATRINTLTYLELFKEFEKFEPYINSILGATSLNEALSSLDSVYEEPLFDDSLGTDYATSYLTQWRDSADSSRRWLIVTGQYGTGKTALTRVLQYRWVSEYRMNPSLPIPFRIELRDFSKQFDERALIHQFLDKNDLNHIPINFVMSLIKSGRIVLLLDGYDEMAQYMHARERRSCLEALAALSVQGAKGVLTSRPNYFSETEELQVFEVLYKSVSAGRHHIGQDAAQAMEKEREIDALLQSQFLSRFERSLRDLTPEQTKSLVQRILREDEIGKSIVLDLLDKIYRQGAETAGASLSGKPVIVNYLMEIVESLKTPDSVAKQSQYSEWDIYKMIVDKLMWRDFNRAPEVTPEERRRFLHALSLLLSNKNTPVVDETGMKDLIAKVFSKEYRKQPGDLRQSWLEMRFADMRSSATLTRSSELVNSGWRFSHNSLREFLLTEHLIETFDSNREMKYYVPITDPMRFFVGSFGKERLIQMHQKLVDRWNERTEESGIGVMFSLLWSAFKGAFAEENRRGSEVLLALSRGGKDLSGVNYEQLQFSSDAEPLESTGLNFADSSFSRVDWTSARIASAHFDNCLIENSSFSNATLGDSSFNGSVLIDVDFCGTELSGASFKGIPEKNISIFVDDSGSYIGRVRISGAEALGYLIYKGAIGPNVPNRMIYKHHPKYDIVNKIILKLTENAVRQERGLTQKGSAMKDVPFARKFMVYLKKEGIVEQLKKGAEVVRVTETGRNILSEIELGNELPKAFIAFLDENTE